MSFRCPSLHLALQSGGHRLVSHALAPSDRAMEAQRPRLSERREVRRYPWNVPVARPSAKDVLVFSVYFSIPVRSAQPGGTPPLPPPPKRKGFGIGFLQLWERQRHLPSFPFAVLPGFLRCSTCAVGRRRSFVPLPLLFLFRV